MIEEIRFKNVRELFDFLAPWNENDLHGYVFRGHSKEEYELIPNALRPNNVEHFWQLAGGKPIENQFEWLSWQIGAEFRLLREFYRLADSQGLPVPVSDFMRANLAQSFDPFTVDMNMNDIQWIPSDLLESVALAQHYGIPTRLLDWTYDRYVALYFSFQGALDSEGNMVIWALNKDHLAFLKPTVDSSNVEFITPHYSQNPNISAQKGLFTHWPVKKVSKAAEAQMLFQNKVQLVDRRPLDVLISETHSHSEVTIFKKLFVPASEALKGRRILREMGYGTSSIFPGYDGVAREILELRKYS